MSTTPANSIDGIAVWNGHEALGTSTLSWAGDAILAVEPSTADSAALAEYSIIPGLVDTHVHISGYAGTRTVDWSSWPIVTPAEEKTLHIAANARKAASMGITTLRDLAGDENQMAVARVFDEGILPGPRLLVSGQVGMTAGHGDLFVPPHYPVRDRLADSPDECRKLVRHWARAGATGIKIYLSGGVLSIGDKVGWRNQTLEEIRTTIDEAHALGLPVAAHTHSAEGVEIALAEGVDSIEHGTGVSSKHWAELVEKNIPVAPTLMINNFIADGTVSFSEEAQQKAKQVVAERDAGFVGAGAAGVRFVLGTDANGKFVVFGDQYEEIRMMAETFEWTAERALVAATSDAADVVGMAAKVGTLAEGFGADFIVIKGRPWENIDDMRVENIVAVVSRGVVVSGELPS
ncbi:imidazolonepropionase-like amidohydrolase [Conyzicola lurida]|uniref:Imidazolonepropionase-like amidohydrolase n=1 Tax=Conyzicola lurida TaxID=1172621 RepID=A0A841AKV3_9MICO|nr:amidohydrolase family protein [Conyzicola lurida]MBB5842336.1 imidazolonepropionase-like amidohydrolase [Conyzicola lurida]